MGKNNIKILIIRLSSIGDVLLTTSFLRQARKRFKSAQIDYIIKKEFKYLLIENHNISNLIILDPDAGFSELLRIRKDIKAKKYTYIFDLHKNYRSLFLRIGNKANYVYSIKKNKIKQALLVFFKWNLYKDIIPIARRYSDVGRPAGIEDDGGGLDLFWDAQVDKKISKILARNGINKSTDFFSIAPGAGYHTKKWPVEYFLSFVASLNTTFNKSVVILGGEQDINIGNELGKISGVVNLINKLSLLETAAILSRSKVLVSNDSGLMHMATAVHTPVLAIFGSTVRELGFFPWRGKNMVIENKDLNCRPCSHLGKNSCPKKHFSCMKDLTPDIVLDKFTLLCKDIS